ncbi:MAG: ATP-binding cassette domain-containing protein [Bacilli bacterium]
MIEIKNLTITMLENNRTLLENFNFVLNNGDKVAIIGEEGNGKSTLLKTIYDKRVVEGYCSISGNINKKGIVIGYFDQFLNPGWNDQYVYEYFLKDNPEDEIDYEKYNDLAEVKNKLSLLKIDPKKIEEEQKIGTLSGGEKVKIQLAKLLMKNPGVLLLDEPTNDLDIETLEWLETFINSAEIPIIFISHDETLLERTANTIIHLEQLKKKNESKYTTEKIGYSDYVEKRLGALQKQEQIAQNEKRYFKREMQTLKEIKNKVQKKNPDRINRMNSIIAQEKKLGNTDLTESPDVEEAIKFNFNENIAIPNGKIILDYKKDSLKIGDKEILRDISLIIKGPEKVVIIGKNGVGKSTLFKDFYNILKDRDDITLGYMPQNYGDFLDAKMNASTYLNESGTKEEETRVRMYMGSMKFTGDEMLTAIENLSGGQKAKLLLLKMILTNSNVLLLDEPTRNLSPLSNPVVRGILKNYGGTIISVSHDRKFINEVCDIVYELNENGIKKTII